MEFEFFYIQSSPFFLAVFCPFIGRVARYTPFSRPKNVTKIKANLEFQKSSDDFSIYFHKKWQDFQRLSLAVIDWKLFFWYLFVPYDVYAYIGQSTVLLRNPIYN